MNEKEIKALQPKTKRYKIYLGSSLLLEVMPTGRKFYRIKQVASTKTLGESPYLSLKEAQILARDYFEQLKQIEPAGKLFGELFDEWLEHKDWAESTRVKRSSVFTKYLKPFRKFEVNKIKKLDIIEEIKKIEKEGKYETASRALGILKQIFDYGILCGYTENNPAIGLSAVLRKVKSSPRASLLEEEKIKKFVKSIDSYNKPLVKALLQFTMYTLCRPSECRLAKWSEINGDVWTIPAERMKMRKEHTVPLSKQCLEILEKLKQESCGEYIFTSTGIDKPLHENAMLLAIRKMGFAKSEMSVHGFRSMGSTILNEKGYRPDVIEKALAHAGEDKIRAIYNRAEYFEERKQMLQDYADYLENLTSE